MGKHASLYNRVVEKGNDVPFVVNSSNFQSENLNVVEQMERFREKVTLHYQSAFQTIPELKTRGNMQVNQYIRKYPESVIFVPKKDLHLFPIVVEEAKKFSDVYQIKNSVKTPTYVRDHEFEHVQKVWDLNVDLKGVGFVMYKKAGSPIFGGFVTIEPDQQPSTVDQFKILLAPKNPSNADWFGALKVIWGKGNIGEIIRNIDNQEVLLVLSDKLFPKPISDLVEKQMGKS